MLAWAVLSSACSNDPKAGSTEAPPPDRAARPPSAAPAEEPPVTVARQGLSDVEEIAVEGDLPAYALRSAGELTAVFLGGSCTHPRASMEVLRRAATEHGTIVALQGDQPCKGEPSLRRWSPDASALSDRIDAALRAAGVAQASDLVVIGYSQGAERAEWLANRFREKYTRFVLVAGPIVPSPGRFGGARGVVAMAGPGDVRENMALGARRLRRSSIPAIYMELPTRGQHSELAPAAAEAVSGALEWLEANAAPAAARPPRHPNRGARR